ncbi:response regulator [Pollutibacter soli]|uniref:response regulator n=1 Tax=Pollutibacter soli TaxID=3034157 RepID=UPI003013B7A7
MNSFKKNLFIGYGVSLFLLLASSLASYLSIRGLVSASDLVNHTYEVSRNLDNVMASLRDAESGQRGYLITGDERFLAPFNGAEEKTYNLIRTVKRLTSDNPAQQADCERLLEVASQRLQYLGTVVARKRAGQHISDSLLSLGKNLMDKTSTRIKTMQDREEQLLEARSEELTSFATATPILIIIASILGFAVTIVSMMRLIKDSDTRYALLNELEIKDAEIRNRIKAVDAIANEISSGNYDVKINEETSDALGGIAVSLNRMSHSLQHTFNSLGEKEWMQSGIARLSDVMIGDQNMHNLAHGVLNFVADYLDANAGAFYIANGDGDLELKSTYAIPSDYKYLKLTEGEGFAGQAAVSGKMLEAKNIPADQYAVRFISGDVSPKSVLAIPIYFNRVLKGVIELASLGEFSTKQKSFLEAAVFGIGTAINTTQSKQRVEELLEETQSQSEELQSQHSELENINAELEAQAEKLQASEEELKVQQEELLQTNRELEERSRELEEKNELILERNLDIQKKAEELALSTRYKSEFLANMSHELRTPLNSILLLSRLLSENHPNNLKPEQIEYADVIQTSGKGLLTLIDEILDLSKIEAGKMDLEYSDVMIQSVADGLSSLLAPLAKEKGIGFSIDVDDDVPGMMETDRLRLEQILKNLLSNALKFTKKGSVRLHIRKSGSNIVFNVIDTGIGIPAEKQLTIFEAFQQADGSTRRQYGGTGLGLSISRELAKLLGGEIQLKSEEGKGSEFTLLVPMRKSKTQESFAESVAPEINPMQAEHKYISEIVPSAIPDDRNSISAGDKVILIIEDDTSFAKSLLDFTRNKGYKGVVAVRGDEGIQLAKEILPTGILLDVQLPVKSGWQVMDELKADTVTRPLPVHMMSSHEVRMKSLSKGAVDFISKPVAFEKLSEMFKKIEEALTRHPKKVLIVEENTKHAEALSYFLHSYQVVTEIKTSVKDGIRALNNDDVDCVILDMGIPTQGAYDTLEEIKKTKGFETLPIIIFTGKNLSHVEEVKLKKYVDSIVIKTAHSYERILDEVSLFLHLVEENRKESKGTRYKRLGELSEVLKGKKVLVADDDVRNIFSVSKSLETFGVDVISAMDGREALEQLEKNPDIDLVLMDMMMPEMDGYESTRRIRENPKYRQLPVIAVTAKAMTGDREKCINAGASDYITKPVDIDQLISLLRVWLYHQ